MVIRRLAEQQQKRFEENNRTNAFIIIPVTICASSGRLPSFSGRSSLVGRPTVCARLRASQGAAADERNDRCCGQLAAAAAGRSDPSAHARRDTSDRRKKRREETDVNEGACGWRARVCGRSCRWLVRSSAVQRLTHLLSLSCCLQTPPRPSSTPLTHIGVASRLVLDESAREFHAEEGGGGWRCEGRRQTAAGRAKWTRSITRRSHHSTGTTTTHETRHARGCAGTADDV